MKWIGLSVLAISASALGDAAVPPPRAGTVVRGDGRPAWVGQCAERLERARDEAALRLALLKDATVEATARERGEPGDPTAKVAVDVVHLQLVLGDGPVLDALVEPEALDGAFLNSRWGDGGLRDGLSRQRKDHGFRASYYVHLKAQDRAPVGAILQRALDDCLKRAK